jgi:hypothetical protein
LLCREKKAELEVREVVLAEAGDGVTTEGVVK